MSDQIQRTTAENFASWFRESKVKKHTGEPLVVYHGTADGFDVFDATKVGSRHVDVEAGPAFFFSDDIKTANWYAKSAHKQAGGGANVRAVYLSLQNPLIVDFQETGIEYLREDIEKARENGHDGLIALNYDDGGVSTHYIAFSPHQVKSVHGNSGAYDPSDPDITDRRAALAQNALSWLGAAGHGQGPAP